MSDRTEMFDIYDEVGNFVCSLRDEDAANDHASKNEPSPNTWEVRTSSGPRYNYSDFAD